MNFSRAEGIVFLCTLLTQLLLQCNSFSIAIRLFPHTAPNPRTHFRTQQCQSKRSRKKNQRLNASEKDKEETDELPENLRQTPDDFLEYSIDSFLRGDYDRPLADDAAAPLPGLTPGATVEAALRSLRQLDDPEPSHGAAVLLRFCAPLSRGERWGGAPSSGQDQWKQVLRGALTPTMLARRIRATQEFSGLLDWTKLDVTEGAYGLKKNLVGVPTIAFVSAALYYEDGVEPTIIQFTLKRIGGVWLIDSARRSEKGLFVDEEQDDEETQI
jgi:hypothetical protein